MLASVLPPSLSRRSLALGVCLALAVPAGLASSPQLAQAARLAPAEDPALTEARALYDEGKARFDTFDYSGAVELWTKAYARLPDDAAGVRNAMVYNIATAQEKSYELDKNVQHLRQAVLLLEQYVKNYTALYQRTPETQAEIDKAQARIAVLQERIAKAERGEDVTPPPATDLTPGDPATDVPGDARYGSGAVDGISWTTGHNPPPDPALLSKNQRLAAENNKTDHMLIASYVTLSVGAVFTLGGAGALYGGSRVSNNGAVGAGYGTLAFGVAGLVTGVTLMIVGFDRRKKAREGTLVAATPVVAPGFAGASMRVRF